MLNYDLPLTKAEADFAAEHHDLIYRYLCKAGLSEEEGYDIVVFGYLRAVRKYLARPELRQYQFSTLAYRAMSCNLHHSREYWLRQKRKGSVESYDEDIHADDLHDPVADAFEQTLSFQELSGKLTHTQRRIAALRSEGYHDREIAAICRINPSQVEQEMEQARAAIIPFPVQPAALAA